MVRKLSIVLFLAASLTGLSDDFRAWTDSTGRFTLNAEFVKLHDGKVVLKRDDGKIITVPVERLSDEDRTYLKVARSSTPTEDKPFKPTADELERLANVQRTATDAVKLYEAFLATGKLPAADATAAREQLERWKKRQVEKQVRVGDKWMPLADAETLEAECKSSYEEAIRLFDVGNFDEASRLLRKSSDANPEAFTSDFLLGWIHALIRREPQEAARHFARCVARRTDNLATRYPEERINLVASLNNLAITDVRRGNYRSAITRWNTAIEIGPISADLVQNIGRLAHLSTAYPYLPIPSLINRDAGLLYARIAAGKKADIFAKDVGWLYIPMVPEPSFRDRVEEVRKVPLATPAVTTKRDLVLFSSGSGFVVKTGYVITNRHVIDNADYLEIVPSLVSSVALPATVLAVAESEDLALLQCNGLESPPLGLTSDVPRLGAGVVVLGYPQIEEVGWDLKATRGIVSGLPNPRVDNLLLFDAVMNHGNSGGPVCDQTGQVVAVSVKYCSLEVANLTAGVPAPKVLDFIKPHIAVSDLPVDLPKSRKWEDIVAEAGNSTVLIHVYKKTASTEFAKKLMSKTFEEYLSRRREWNEREDWWCMVCNGSSFRRCTNKQCKNGVILSQVPTQVGVDKLLGQPQFIKKVVRSPCPDCQGKSVVDCPFCVSGIDPNVKTELR